MAEQATTPKVSIKVGGLPLLLTITFLILRLCDQIDWAWYWVVSPLWITAGIVVLIAILLAPLAVKVQ